MSHDQKRFPNCRFFHYDYLRGHERMECRLLRKSGYAALWNLKLCERCPVPRILEESTCRHLVLEAEVVRKWGLFPRVQVFAVCSASLQTLDNPLHCPHCEAEERS